MSTILQIVHDSKLGSHFRFVKIISRLSIFYWILKSRDAKSYVDRCMKCQEFKYFNQRKLAYPEKFEIPEPRCGSLSMYFLVGLPKRRNLFHAFTIWVDRLSKRVHVLKSKRADTAVDVADSFFKNIFKHQVFPDSIASDCDLNFRSMFWRRLLERSGVQLKISMSQHPQTNGASEILNTNVETI